MKWFLKVLRQYADFEGRASQREFWMTVLFNFLFATAVFIISLIVSLIRGSFYPSPALSYMYMFALLLPGWAVAARRLHDSGRSAWYLLLSLIPFIGGIWLLVLFIVDGTPGENRYGKNPSDNAEPYTFNKTKSVGITLIVASVVWFVTSLLDFFQNIPLPSIVLSSIAAIGFLLAGISLLQKRKINHTAGWGLIVTSGIWIINLLYSLYQILTSIYIDSSNYNYLYFLMAIVPVALLMLGLNAVQLYKNKQVVKIWLLVAACVWAVHLIRISFQLAFDFNIYGSLDIDEIYNLLNIMRISALILLPVSVLWLALLLNPAASTSETNLSEKPIYSSEKRYYERDNKGMRVDTVSQSMSYWVLERFKSSKNDPFVYYVFKNEEDAKAAMLELPFIHQAADTGKLICDDVFRFGYFAMTNDGQLTGEYDAFIAGSDFTHDMWTMAHAAFTKHNGVKKNELEPEKKSKTQLAANGNASKVTFVRENRDNTSVWRVHRASSKADALAFLSQHPIDRPLYYMIVETPEGNFGRDIDGFYQE